MGQPGPRAQKVENGVEKESESTVFELFWLLFDSVFDFLGTGAERPRELIFQMTPVAGKTFRKLIPKNERITSEIYFLAFYAPNYYRSAIRGSGINCY